MKYFILSAFCVVAIVASPLDEPREKKYVKIPNGFGGIKYMEEEAVQAELEIQPTFNPPADMSFHIFTRQNPLIPHVVSATDMAGIRASHWVPNRKTVFIAHGWQSNVSTEVNPITTAAYLRHVECNVVVIDWSVGAGNINYITSVQNVNPAGAHVALFMRNLMADGLLDISQTSCCGQSLGSHVCGFAGKNTNGQMREIFGLDPAGPLFSVGNPAGRLASGDAQYVENVHTDIVALGIGDPIGDVDYYPNGGRNQPGCLTAVCDHAIAPRLHVDTLDHPGLLWGRECSSLDQKIADACTGAGHPMGGYPSNHGRGLSGIFRMNTNENPPLGQGPF